MVSFFILIEVSLLSIHDERDEKERQEAIRLLRE